MEMMRSIEESTAAIGQDLTPPLPPLAFVLHDSALTTHCSACFSRLTPPPTPHHAPPTLLYCSPHCSSLDSPLHYPSAEHHLLSLFRHSPLSTWHDSSDLRLALRLLHIFMKNDTVLRGSSGWLKDGQKSYLGGNNENPSRKNENTRNPDGNFGSRVENCSISDVVLERIAGLMTNREMLFESEEMEDCEELEKIREGAKAMAVARSMCAGESVGLCSSVEETEMLLCLVLTNAVEVQDKSGCSVGIAVYGTEFSWINHSCSPNACYRFSEGLDNDEQQALRIYPAANGDGVIVRSDPEAQLSGSYAYGPRVIVRSIKSIKKGEEVTIAYTDLLQPKEMRQAELWLKYKFRCSCKRCTAVPATYVDCSLQAICTVSPDYQNMITDHDCCTEEEIKELNQRIDDAITEYLSYNKPKLCCEKLENLLAFGKLDEPLEPKATKSRQKLKLHPFNYVTLNAYTALTSAYKVCASDLLAIDSGTEVHIFQAFNMCKASAAYSLLLAGVSNHLFMCESSLLGSAANAWINAGELLLNLSRNKLWDSFVTLGHANLEISSLLRKNCDNCSLADFSDQNSVDGCFQKLQLEKIFRQQSNCIANMTSKVWRSLSSGSDFLKSIKNPIDFSWLKCAESLWLSDIESLLGMSVKNNESSSNGETAYCTEQLRKDLILLSTHCLRYGALLSSICYGFPLSVDMYSENRQ